MIMRDGSSAPRLLQLQIRTGWRMQPLPGRESSTEIRRILENHLSLPAV
jgi:hypothetical protein